MPLSFPEPQLDEQCTLLFIPVSLVPIVGALFSQLEKRARWSTDNDYEQGYRAFVELQDQLMNNCVKTLVDEIRAIRGVKPDYASVPIEERDTTMYRDFNDIIGHLNTIIFALSGGEEHTDHILMALRGTTPASDTRNIIEEL